MPVVSSSLLLNLDLNVIVHVPNEFDIDMGKWMSPPVRRKHGFSLMINKNTRQFAAPVSPTSLQKAAEGIVPVNTEASTEWAR